MAKRSRRFGMAIAMVGFLSFIDPLYAQQTISAEPPGLQEIIVTAQKRAESVQDVPIAVSAITAADLAELGIRASKDIDGTVPNLRWVASDGLGVNSVFIRGVGDISFHLNQVGAVGLYMDEVSLNSPILGTFGLFDLQRVEVLRGPQNTLFGRNTTGGAIQFVSQKPDLNAGWTGYATVNGGNFGRFDIEAALNVPVNERVAVRLSVARFAQGDYLNNLFLNKKEGGYQRSSGRAQLLWKVTDDLDALFSTNIGTFRGSVVRYKEIGLGTPGNPASVQCPYNLVKAEPGNGCVDQTGFADSGNYTNVYNNGVNIFEINTKGGSARFDWRLPAVTLTSLTAFEHADSKRAEDSTGGPSYIFDFQQGSNTDQWSEELRAASTNDAKLRWIAGLYFFDEQAFWSTVANRANPALTNVLVPGVNVPATGWTSLNPFTLTNQKDKVYSAYGQLEYKLTDKLRVTTGLRFTSEVKSGVVKNGIATDTTPTDNPDTFLGADQINAMLMNATQVPAGSALRLACPHPLPFTECDAYTPFKITNNSVGGKASLDYHFSDAVLGYGSISRGFKSGGVSIAALDYVARGGSSVEPEYLLTYELGLKTQTASNRVRMNIALFDNQWSNEQLFLALKTPGTGLNPVYTNVPKTESYGADVEVEWAPTRDWFARSTLGILHSRVIRVGEALTESGAAMVGSVLIASPKTTWNGLVRREWNVPGGRASLQGNWSFTGSQHFDLINTPDQIEPSYWLFNTRAAYSFGEQLHYDIALWGKNLTRTQYCEERQTDGGIPFGNVSICIPNEAQRFFGVTFSAKF